MTNAQKNKQQKHSRELLRVAKFVLIKYALRTKVYSFRTPLPKYYVGMLTASCWTGIHRDRITPYPHLAPMLRINVMNWYALRKLCTICFSV